MKKKIILSFSIILVLTVVLIAMISNNRIKNENLQLDKKKMNDNNEIVETKIEFKGNSENKVYVLISFYSQENLIKNIKVVENKEIPEEREIEINGEGRSSFAIDYGFENEMNNIYDFIITTNNGNKIKYTYNISAFLCNESYGEYIAPETDEYIIECLGARGGYSRADGWPGAPGGNGGYTKGTINLQKDEKLYVYVGGKGADAIVYNDSIGGYNGGGLGTWDHSDNEAAGAGGGATDIRLVSGNWNEFDSLKSRIMVAARWRRRFLVY